MNKYMIDELTIQRVKDAASIVDVIGDFYELKRSGTEYECRCPFHNDRHLGSFKVSAKKNFAKCFACGWQGGPVDFLMEHEHLSFADAIRWLGKKYGIDVEGADQMKVRPATPRKALPALPMLQLPISMVTHSARQLGQGNTLVEWLRSGVNWSDSQRANLEKAINDYRIGGARQGHVMFWQIDNNMIVRTGKMMLYKADGHRDKDAQYNFDWVHSALFRMGREEWSADKCEVKPCLFGLHLLNSCQDKTEVCIVESEKTAIIMAAAYGNNEDYVWMACGGMGNITREKLEPIMRQKRQIVLYPDRDGIEEWQRRAHALNYPHVVVETDMVTRHWMPEDGEKADVADIVVRLLNENLEDKKRKSAALTALDDEFQLKVL